MSNNRTKLEPTWIGKGNRLKLEPAIRLENPEKPCHSAHQLTDCNLFYNMSARSYHEFLKSAVGFWKQGGS